MSPPGADVGREQECQLCVKHTLGCTCGIILDLSGSFHSGVGNTVCLTLGKGKNLLSKIRWTLNSKGQPR